MNTLQSVAMGLVIVFLDAGSNGWDWIMDPVGWVLVLLGLHPVKELLPAHKPVVVSAWACLAVSILIFPPDSVDAIDPSLGWLFSLPTVAFCFLLCDSLVDVAEGSLATCFRVLRATFVVVGLLPALIYLVGWSSLTLPTAIAAVLANLVLIVAVWMAGSEDESEDARRATTPPAARKAAPVAAPTPRSERPKGGRRKKRKDAGFDAEAVKRRARRARGG